MSKNKNLKNEPKTAVCYFRSTFVDQNRASIAQQEFTARKYAKERGINIIAEYSEVGAAASLDKRPEIQKLLCDLRYLKPDCILIWKANRISRDVFDQMFFQKMAKKAGCEIIYTAESNKNDADEDMIMKTFMSALADKYEKMANIAASFEEEKC